MEIKVSTYKSPVGELILGSAGDKLCLCDWKYRKMRTKIDARILKLCGDSFMESESAVTDRAAAELDDYFNGTLKIFTTPLLLAGSDFQKMVWNEILTIGFGQTDTYMSLASRLGRPDAVRAVAAAVGANALSIFVPCHRIIGSSGELTGYAGGLRAKRFLLDLEDKMRLF